MSTPRFESKLTECQKFIESYRKHRQPHDDFVALELGTGWYPIIPLGLYLCGAREVHTIDIHPLLSRKRVRRALELIIDSARSGTLLHLLPAYRHERVRELEVLLSFVDRESPAALLDRIGIKVIVTDARSIPLPDHAVDLIFSSVVLAHIPAAVLVNIMAEFQRVAKPDATMAHLINLVDQYSFFDRSITPFNYLKYTSSQWRWLNSPLIWQNGLRLSDYKRLIANSGFRVVEEENVLGLNQDLDRVKLAPEYEKYHRDDLLVLRSYLACRPVVDRAMTQHAGR